MTIPTVVSFDIGNTLINLNSGKGFCMYFCEQVGMSLPEIRELLNEHFLCSNLPMDVAVKKVCDLIGFNPYNKIVGNYKPTNKLTLFDDVIPVLKALKNNGVMMIAFSNCTPWEASGLGDFALNEYISKVYYSYDIGSTKPHKKAFDYVKIDNGVRANEILHIGDTYDSDAKGALNAAWNACWLNRKREPLPNDYDERISVITSLWDLEKLLKLQVK